MKKSKKILAYPVTRRGWRDYYIELYNKFQSPEAAILAMWYDFLLLAESERNCDEPR